MPEAGADSRGNRGSQRSSYRLIRSDICLKSSIPKNN